MQLHVTQYGEPQGHPPLLILHGLFGSNRNWHPIAQSLSQKRCIYTLDLRNHGKSPHAESMNYSSIAQDVLEFVQQRFDASQLIDIIGHSMGGKAAMWLALTCPERIHKLLVVDIAPVNYDHDFSDILQGLKAIPLTTLTSRQDADRILAKMIPLASLRQFLLQNLQLKEGRYYWRLNLAAITHSMPEIIAFPDTHQVLPYPKRVLFIGGKESNYLNKDKQQATKALFPLASFSMIKSAGHWLHAEQPEIFRSMAEAYFQ